MFCFGLLLWVESGGFPGAVAQAVEIVIGHGIRCRFDDSSPAVWAGSFADEGGFTGTFTIGVEHMALIECGNDFRQRHPAIGL